MPRNSSQASILDKMEQEMEQKQAQEQAQEPEPGQAGEAKNDPAGAQAETKEKFTPKPEEKGYYHVKLEKLYFDKKTGKKLSTPTIQKMSKAEYKALTSVRGEKDKSNAEMLGYTVELLWNPETDI